MSAGEAKVVTVRLANESYDIVVQPGLLTRVGEMLAGLAKSRRAMLVSDANVAPKHGSALGASCSASGISIDAECVIPPGEDHKSIDQIVRAYDAFLRAKIERSTPILALGGGMIGDMAGFIAATTLRGVPFVQVPTTLLAMVDASVGGKTGVNHAVGKNLIGAFHQPIAVFIDPQTLRTLPPRELRGGLAECIKHDVIRDAEGFTRLEREVGRALALDMDYLTDLVAHNVEIKARVVEADPFEYGERAHLNFGHTFGHAIETASRYEYSHGESVALGMAAASTLARDMGLLDDASRRRIIDVIRKAGLPVSGLTLPASEVIETMYFDKKVKGGRLRFVLPDRIGHVVIRDDAPTELVTKAVDSLR
jgi:3-dehydroquinate synthase